MECKAISFKIVKECGDGAGDGNFAVVILVACAGGWGMWVWFGGGKYWWGTDCLCCCRSEECVAGCVMAEEEVDGGNCEVGWPGISWFSLAVVCARCWMSVCGGESDVSV